MSFAIAFVEFEPNRSNISMSKEFRNEPTAGDGKGRLEQIPGEATPDGSGADLPEMRKEKDFFEESRKVGDYYISLIGSFTGKTEVDPQGLEGVETAVSQKLNRIYQRAKDGFEKQKIQSTLMNMDAKQMLQQVPVFRSKNFEQLLSDNSKYRLEELNKGVFVIYMDPVLANELRPGASAAAVKVKDGLSFMLVPEYSDAAQRQSQIDENIPHETHHLVWNFSKDHHVHSTEKDEDFKDGFTMYQEEVIARLVSDGGLAGYTHLVMLDPETRARFEQDHPETAKKLTETMIELNDILQGIDAIRKQTTIRKQDLIMTVMEATNFDELRNGLLKVKNLLEQQPKVATREQYSAGGWDSV